MHDLTCNKLLQQLLEQQPTTLCGSLETQTLGGCYSPLREHNPAMYFLNQDKGQKLIRHANRNHFVSF